MTGSIVNVPSIFISSLSLSESFFFIVVYDHTQLFLYRNLKQQLTIVEVVELTLGTVTTVHDSRKAASYLPACFLGLIWVREITWVYGSYQQGTWFSSSNTNSLLSSSTKADKLHFVNKQLLDSNQLHKTQALLIDISIRLFYPLFLYFQPHIKLQQLKLFLASNFHSWLNLKFNHMDVVGGVPKRPEFKSAPIYVARQYKVFNFLCESVIRLPKD